jgi:cytochrome b6-f complex iron-sulfur subunit
MKRRDLINWVGLGMLASSLPVAIAACRSSDTASTSEGESAPTAEIDSTPREDGFAAIATVAELDEKGSISKQNFLGEQLVVIRTPTAPNSIVAVNSLCTHQGCTVAWDDSDGVFACPCHGSQFSSDGSVVSGPAAAPLGTFEAKTEDDLVLVKVS